MALWPFGKKSKQPAETPEPAVTQPGPETPEPAEGHTDAPAPSPEGTGPAATVEHDAVHGSTGPFDGDNVEIEDFDFSDFASGVLDLGSMKLAVPQGAQVQVEMGEKGPKMLHLVTRSGRITPVAFAAPTTGGQWEQASQDILDGMHREGNGGTFEAGPWGREVVTSANNNVMRIIGIDGPRWMLRLTVASPADKAEAAATIARDIAARTFVYRGNDPILAGNSLPVVMPAQLVEQVQKAMTQRVQQNQAQQQAAQEAQQSEAVREAAQALRNLSRQNRPSASSED